MRTRIVDRGREELTLYPEKVITNAKNNTIRVADMDHPVTLLVNASTGRQSDAELPGQVSVRVMNIFCKDAPVGSWAQVKFRGEMWDVFAPPTKTGFTKNLEHVEFTIRSRNQVA